jgi:hypothetical protein
MKTQKIAFFWVGGDTSIPKMLVRSIQSCSGQHKIYHLTDRKTETIKGTKCIRSDLSSEIMTARLQAYCKMPINNEYTLFCDADSLFLNNLDLAKYEKDILLVERQQDFPINPNYPEHYPEFENRLIKEVMPFLFGAIAVKNNTRFFADLLESLLKLPDRFHRWYGDQIALSQRVRVNSNDVGLIPQNIFLDIIRSELSTNDLIQKIKSGTQIITFKGNSKNIIAPTLEKLLSLKK